MRYLTAKEIKSSHYSESHEVLGKCTGKSVRDLFAIKVFIKYYHQLLNDKTLPILDLGPASGGFASQIYETGYTNISGVDVDNYLKDQNRTLFKEFKTADLSWDRIPWPDNNFKVVTAWCVLPHIENPFHCLREIHRVLDNNGLFIFTTPHLTSKPSIDYFAEKEDFGSYRASNNHIILFPRGVVEKTVLKYFDLIETEYHVRPKIFERGILGRLRECIYKASGKISPEFKKRIEKRWSYNIVYILKKRK